MGPLEGGRGLRIASDFLHGCAAFILTGGGQIEQTARESARPVVCGYKLRIVPSVS